MSNTNPTGTGANPPPPPPVPGPPVRRLLQRSRQHRVFGGVAGGLSDYFGIDVVIVRIAFVVLASMAGSGVLAYFAAWFFLPKAPVIPQNMRPSTPSRFGNLDGHQLLAIALVGIGAMTLFDRLGIGINGDVLLPFILIGIGAAVLMSKSSSGPGPGRRGSTIARNGPPCGPTYGPTYRHSQGHGPGRRGFRRDVQVDSEPVQETPVADPETDLIDEFDLLRAPRAREFEAGHLLSTPLPARPVQTPVQPAYRGRSVQRTPFSRSAFGLFLVAVGILTVMSRTGLLGSRIDRVMAAALFIVGAFLTIGAFLGRPRGFVTIGVLLTLFLGVFAVTDTTWRGGFGERHETPLSLQDVQDEYHLAGGVLTLDLSNISFEGKSRTISVDVSAGAVALEVPQGVRVVAKGSAGMGELTLFGRTSSGTDVRKTVTSEGNKGSIELDVHVGFGAIEVARIGELTKLTDLHKPGVTVGSERSDPGRAELPAPAVPESIPAPAVPEPISAPRVSEVTR